MTTPEVETVESLKNKGNECVKNKKFEEAILHYTHAVKLDPENYSLYSNRSLAFLKIQQHYLALHDAEETIRRAPQWAKGYFRRGEVQYASFLFSEAMLSYGRALQLQPSDKIILDALSRAAKQTQLEQRADSQIPWLGAGVGIVVGVAIVIADYVFTKKPTLSHPILMILMTMAIAMMGFGCAKCCRYYVKSRRTSLLQPPVDLFADNEETNTEEDNIQDESTGRNGVRYTKAQARQRFRKGKL